jgi:steroid delta-isomerase-like uncharacterized protein
MSTKDLKALTREAFRELNKGKAAAMAVFDKYVVPKYVFHHPDGKVTRSLEGYKKHLSRAYNAFPDLHFVLDDIIMEGDRVVSRWTLTGTHKKAYVGIPATNKRLKVWGITIDRFAKGNIVESWERFDTLSLMQQLGVIPTPGKRK